MKSPPRSLVELRARRDEVLEVLAGTTAASPWLHLVRDLLDERPRSVKIREAFTAELGALSTNNTAEEVASILCKRIEFRLDRYPLAGVPSYPTALSFSRNLGGQIAHGTSSTLHSSLTSS